MVYQHYIGSIVISACKRTSDTLVSLPSNSLVYESVIMWYYPIWVYYSLSFIKKVLSDISAILCPYTCGWYNVYKQPFSRLFISTENILFIEVQRACSSLSFMLFPQNMQWDLLKQLKCLQAVCIRFLPDKMVVLIYFYLPLISSLSIGYDYNIY